MKYLRSHIARLTVILLLGTGLGLFFTQSVQAHQSPTDFTRWLSAMAKTADAAGLQEDLKDLKQSSYQLNELLNEASKIISRNNEEFQFPFAHPAASQNLYQLLFIQWAQYQAESEMAAVPATKSVSAKVWVSTDHHLPIHVLPAFPKQAPPAYAEMNFSTESQILQLGSLVPMSGGIAINAP